MGTFTPIAMKCTQEQFDAVKPKLSKFRIEDVFEFSEYNYLTNNYADKKNVITNVDEWIKYKNNRTVHEEWNEEIFLKACGIEVDSLEQQLQKAEAEVKRLQYLIEEENKPKVGDWCRFYDDEKTKFSISKLKKIDGEIRFSYETITGAYYDYAEKITNPELIKLLEQEIK